MKFYLKIREFFVMQLSLQTVSLFKKRLFCFRKVFIIYWGKERDIFLMLGKGVPLLAYLLKFSVSILKSMDHLLSMKDASFYLMICFMDTIYIFGSIIVIKFWMKCQYYSYNVIHRHLVMWMAALGSTRLKVHHLPKHGLRR